MRQYVPTPPHCGDHNDRDIAVAPNGSQHFGATYARQHNIQQNEIGFKPPRHFQPFSPVFCYQYVKTIPTEVGFQYVGSIRIVFNYQYFSTNHLCTLVF
jgi:hypothetical protein